jgi:(E)-4-hydroxy-3-methylbut-2-enyl-diphosphate synthase
VDVIAVAQEANDRLEELELPIQVAVMGCVVNGPGEAADADFAVCAGRDKAFFYRNGRKVATVPEAEIVPRLLEALASVAEPR